MSGPLDGVIVVEAGEGITAAYCTLLLSSLGAQVVKVEPIRGDETRRMGPFPGDIPDRERSAHFLALNRNKRSVALDLDTPTGQEVFASLVRRAHIVVENEAPGRMEGRGIGYERFAAELPSLVWTSITPFGQAGDYRDLPATELTLFALSGLMLLVGDISREPLMFQGHPMFHSAGIYAFSAASIALELAETSGVGQHIDVAVLDGAAASHFQAMVEYEYRGSVRRRGEMQTPIPTQDGFMSFTVQAHQYGDFRRLILGEDAGDIHDGESVIDRDRQHAEGEMDTEILMWSVQQTKYEAYTRAQSAHVPAAFLAGPEDLLGSPQYEHRGYWVSLNHPDAGELRYPGFPAKITGMEPQWSAAPRLSEDADQILADYAGLTPDEIAEIRAAGVVK